MPQISGMFTHSPAPSGGCRYLSPRELIALTGLSDTTLWRMRQRGDLPEPVRLSPGRVAWREDVISEWLENRSAVAGTRADQSHLRRRVSDR